MSAQKWVRVYPNGQEFRIVSYKVREAFVKLACHLTLTDLNRIEVALRLRAESEHDLGNYRKEGAWKGTHARVQNIINKLKGTK